MKKLEEVRGKLSSVVSSCRMFTSTGQMTSFVPECVLLSLSTVVDLDLVKMREINIRRKCITIQIHTSTNKNKKKKSPLRFAT